MTSLLNGYLNKHRKVSKIKVLHRAKKRGNFWCLIIMSISFLERGSRTSVNVTQDDLNLISTFSLSLSLSRFKPVFCFLHFSRWCDFSFFVSWFTLFLPLFLILNQTNLFPSSKTVMLTELIICVSFSLFPPLSYTHTHTHTPFYY